MDGFDVVIRRGTVIDGTGAPARVADVAVTDGRIVEVGEVTGRGRREIDATGLLVTPGFVDIHAHYDGQVAWDSRLLPSAWHGVTTIVMGNCGVGFAPVRPTDHDVLIELMEGVEDIPGTALHEGLPWGWESFDQYLDAIDHPFDIDVAAQVPHSAVRLYVMGTRGADGEPATPEDIARMGEIVADAIRAGAIGFTTSRTRNHRTARGAAIPTLRAEAAELIGIASALGATGKGVVEIVSDFDDVDTEMDMLVQVCEASGRPLSISLAASDQRPGNEAKVLAHIEKANAAGHTVRAQVPGRAIGILLGFDATINPFVTTPSYRSIAALPREEKVRVLADPTFRDKVLAEHGDIPGGRAFIHDFGRMFVLGTTPDYEPTPEKSIAAEADRRGVDAAGLAYDMLLADEGRSLLYMPFLNWIDGSLDTARTLLAHPHSVVGLADGGAHVGTICDASFPTTMLTHWGRDRAEGRFDLPFIVHRMTQGTATTVGLTDRGVLAPGMRADINVIDHEELTLHHPQMHHDLPAGGRRLLQRATGYRHTFVNGVETYADGEHTGALPGRLVRGGR